MSGQEGQTIDSREAAKLQQELRTKIAHLEREQAEDRAAIQHFVGKHHCRQCEIEHAAAIARAQEGKGP